MPRLTQAGDSDESYPASATHPLPGGCLSLRGSHFNALHLRNMSNEFPAGPDQGPCDRPWVRKAICGRGQGKGRLLPPPLRRAPAVLTLEKLRGLGALLLAYGGMKVDETLQSHCLANQAPPCQRAILQVAVRLMSHPANYLISGVNLCWGWGFFVYVEANRKQRHVLPHCTAWLPSIR